MIVHKSAANVLYIYKQSVTMHCTFFFFEIRIRTTDDKSSATGAVPRMTANYCTPRESLIEMCAYIICTYNITLWIIHNQFSPTRCVRRRLQWRYREYRRFMNNTFWKFGGSMKLRIILRKKNWMKTVAG